jgi:hypothetical protein
MSLFIMIYMIYDHQLFRYSCRKGSSSRMEEVIWGRLFSGVDMKKLKLVMFMCYLWWKLLNWPNYRCVWSSLSSLHFGVWEWFVHYRFLVLHEATIPKFMSCLFSSIISGLSILFVFFPEVCMILTRTFLGVTKYLCVLNFDLNILW